MIEKQCDLLVLGGGGSGLTAAVRAAQLSGKKVIVVEKAPRTGGGMLMASTMRTFRSRWQEERGLPDVTDAYLRRVMDATYWRLDPTLAGNAILATGQFFDWFCELAGDGVGDRFRVGRYVFDGEDGPLGPQLGGPGGVTGGGRLFMDTLFDKCAALGVEVLTNHRALEAQAENGRVAAVVARGPDGEVRIRCRVCILAVGSWINNDEVMARICPAFLKARPHMGLSPHMNPNYTGDGFAIAAGLGALLEDRDLCLRLMGPMSLSKSGVAARLPGMPYCLYVNADGKRYICEPSQERCGVFNSGLVQLEQPEGLCAVVFDSDNLAAAIRQNAENPRPDAAGVFGQPDLPLTLADARADIAAAVRDEPERVFTADTVEELAEKLGMAPAALKKTVDDYNRFCVEGFDRACFKQPEYLVPLTVAPFYGVRADLGTDGAFGGVRVDGAMRAYARDGGVIDNLYVAGDFASGRFINMTGVKVQLLNDMSWALASGYLAGTNAAMALKEKKKMLRYDHLLAPITLAGLTLKNRMFSAPTSLAELGPGEHYSKENIEYYKLRALGGAAVVPVGDTIVDLDTGRSHPQQVGMNDASAAPYFCAMVDAIHSGGAAAAVQLDHGGALCTPAFIGGKNAVGPSAYTDPWGDSVEALTEEQICALADKFAEAAANAKDYGFDMVQIHGGHGWLIHQFISPLTNHREDKWGGSLDNRMRFCLLVIERVRAAVGRQFPISIRISGSERTPGGYDLDTGVEIAKRLDGLVDLIHVSAATQQVDASYAYMLPNAFKADMENAYLAAEIKKHVRTPVLAVGAFNIPGDMECFLAETGVDAIALGRALLADPFLPRKVLAGRPEDITPCIRCMECQNGMVAHRVTRCAVNPLIGRECEVFHPLPTPVRKTVLVAGGGPAGMEAALTAQKRGHRVVLCEASDKLGALRFADNDVWFKKPMRRWRDSQVEKLGRSGVDIRLHTRVTKAVVDEVSPDVLIAAVGGEPFAVPVPGADGENVVFGAYITPQTVIGKTVVIIGGGFIGVEEAIALSRAGHEVTILEMRNELATECGPMYKLGLMRELSESENVTQALGLRCTRIDATGVYAADSDGAERLFPCDTVVMASGMRARSAEVEALRPLVPEFYVVGDARRAGKIMNATRDAYDAVTALGML